MNFETALNNQKTARSNVIKAEKNIILKRTALAKAKDTVPISREALTDVMAGHEAEEVSKSEVEKAQREYDKSLSNYEKAKQDLDVAEKVLPKRREQFSKALQDIRKPAYEYYKNESKPLLDELLSTVQNLEAVTVKISDMKTEIEGIRLSSDIYLPTEISGFTLKGRNSKPDFEGYLHEIKEKF